MPFKYLFPHFLSILVNFHNIETKAIKVFVSPQECFFKKAICHSRTSNCLDNYLHPLKKGERRKQSTLKESSYVSSCWANGTEAAHKYCQSLYIVMLQQICGCLSIFLYIYRNGFWFFIPGFFICHTIGVKCRKILNCAQCN